MHLPFRIMAVWLMTLCIAAAVRANANPAPVAQQLNLLKLIDDAGAASSRRFDPQKLIAAVNALQAAGEQHANAALDEYLKAPNQTAPTRYGVPLIARVLFDPRTDGEPMPPLAAGPPNWSPTDPKLFPRFPLVIVDDVPLMVVRTYRLAGAPLDPVKDLDNIRKACRFRTAPLKPTTDLAKLASDATAQVASLENEQLTLDIANQVLHLTASIYEPRKRDDEGRILYRDFDAWWKAVKEDLGALKVTWDAGRNTYVK